MFDKLDFITEKYEELAMKEMCIRASPRSVY